MLAATYPIQILLMTFSGLVNRHQADIIAYLVEENRVRKEKMKGRVLRLNDNQRLRLAAKAEHLGRRALLYPPIPLPPLLASSVVERCSRRENGKHTV